MESITYRDIVFYQPDYDDVRNNRARTNRAVLCGRLKHQPCEICGHEISVAHHEKYSDFLNVRWLCHSDHKIVHALLKKVDHIRALIKYYKSELEKHPDYDFYESYIQTSERELLKLNINKDE